MTSLSENFISNLFSSIQITINKPSKTNNFEMEDEEQQKKTLKDKVNNIEYTRGKLLGTGGFAKCFQVISQDDGKILAAKVIPKKSINQKRQRYKLLVQIKIHRSLKHQHIVEFIQAFEDRENVYILLEYCRNYTLKDLVKRRKRITQYQTRVYIYQVVKALIYIHSQSIIHRDLKLGNILINDDMDTKICDFGLSTRVKHEGEVKKTICGTPNYIAPQILEENGHSYEVDIWSIGVIMYTLLFGKPPFEDNTVEQTYENIKHNRFNYPGSIPVSLPAKDLISKILITDPSKRIGLEEILDHQFMIFREDVPRNLSRSTLAVPPFKFSKIETKRLNLHDINLEMSEEIESYIDESKHDNQSDELSKLNSRKMLKESTKATNSVPFVYIRQCFFSNETIGYLLSNGVVGIFYKNTGMNVVLEYGSANYYIIAKNNQDRPLKKLLPVNEFELNSLMQTDYLQLLLNFKSFFVTKYGVFKMDQMRKKTAMSMSLMIGQEQMESLIYMKKCVKMGKGQILTRLSNSVIQLHFTDLSSLAINREDNRGIYFISEKGKTTEVNYNESKNKLLKTKVRLFSNIMEKLSQRSHAPQGSEDGSQENEDVD